MSLARPGSRTFRALAIGGAGLLLLLAGALALGLDAGRNARPDLQGPVLPGWADMATEAATLEVITPDAMFRLERGETGWVMPSRGNYPVRAEYLAELDAGLAGLRYAAALTRNPARHGDLGVDDPVEGGSGTRLTITDGEGEVLTSLIAGNARGEDGLYLRMTGNPRAFAADGRLPDLSDPGRWLGLDFFNIDPARVARAFIVPESGPAYILERDNPSVRNFDLVSPRSWQLITAGAANGVASAGARLRFRDVGEADAAHDGTPIALHRAITFDGLSYELRFFRVEGRVQARIVIDAASHDVMDEAASLRGASEGYWFEVSEDAFERMTRPLEQAASRAVTPAEE